MPVASRSTSLDVGVDEFGSPVIADIDADAAAQVAERLRRDGRQAVAVPTDVSSWESVQQLADVVGIIDKGHLVHQGSLEELLKAAGGVRVRLLPDEVEPG